MALGAGEVHQAALGQDDDLAAVFEGVLVNQRLELDLGDGVLLEPHEVDLAVEVTGVAQDGAVLHVLEGGGVDDLAVAGDGHPDVGDLGGLGGGHDLVALHVGLERLEGVDLADNDVHAHALGAQGQAAAAVAVAADDHGAAAEQAVGGADDAVEGGLAGAVVVVEEVLGVGVVDVEDGVAQRAVCLHGLESHHAGGGLLRAANHTRKFVGEAGVQRGVEVCAVVHNDLGVGGDDCVDVALVGLGVLAGDGVDIDAVVLDQRGGGVVLGGQRVGGAQGHLGAGCHQGAHEVGGLRGDVHAGTDAHALERLLCVEALLDAGEHGHVACRPLDAGLTGLGERDVLDIGHEGSFPEMVV